MMMDDFDFEDIIQKLIQWQFPDDMCIEVGRKCYYDLRLWYQAVDQIFFFGEYDPYNIIDVLVDAGILEFVRDKGDRLYRLNEVTVHKVLCL
jgi:hypothetical protein